MDYLIVIGKKSGINHRGIYRECPVCGELFFATLANIKRGRDIYCGRKCSGLSKIGKNNHNWKEKIVKICPICGEEFEVFPSNIKYGGGKYCSVKCYAQFQSENQCGENNPHWQGGKVKCICEYCGKEFYTKKGIVENGKGKFCSRACSGKFQSKYYIGENSPMWKDDILKTCEYCGKEFKVKPSGLSRKFCSTDCYYKYINEFDRYAGKDNPNWKGGIYPNVKAFRNSEQYIDWRTSCMARDNFTCQKCGKHGGLLNVHHIKSVKDIFKEYNIRERDDWLNCSELWDLNNGITLCEDCHKELHFCKKEEENVSREEIIND